MFLKRPQYIALSVVVVLTIILLKLPTRATANFKRAVSAMFMPMHGLASSAEDLPSRPATLPCRDRRSFNASTIWKRRSNRMPSG